MNALILRARDRVAGIRRRLAGERGRAALSKPEIPAEAIPFQEGVEEIIEQRLPALLRPGTYFVVALFFSLLLIASVMEVDVVILCPGRFITDTPTVVLQPMENAIIRELKVQPGMKVTKGQLLATLDTTFAGADMASLASQHQSLLAQERRINAELSDKPFELNSSPTPDDMLQFTLYRQRLTEYKNRLRVYEEEILRLRSNISTVRNDLDLARQQLNVARDVEHMRAALEKAQTGSRLQLLESQSNRMRLERDSQELSNRLIELQHSVDSKQAERMSFIDEWRRQLLENLVSLRTAATNAGSGLAKASLLRDLVVLTAPEDGVVQDVAKLSVGSIARGAEPLVTIIPSSARLIAEIMISSSDVGYTKSGSEVIIKVDAFPYNRHGMLEGRLDTTSEDTVVAAAPAGPGGASSQGGPGSGGGGAYYRGRVELTGNKLERLPKGGRLISGMTLSAEIRVGTRTILSYFLSPVTSGLGVSFREL